MTYNSDPLQRRRAETSRKVLFIAFSVFMFTCGVTFGLAIGMRFT